jgi:hypothetical protein
MAGTFRLAAGLVVAVCIPAQSIGNLPSVPGCNLGALGARVTSLNVVCCGSGPTWYKNLPVDLFRGRSTESDFAYCTHIGKLLPNR